MAKPQIEPDKTYEELCVGGLGVAATLEELEARLRVVEAKLKIKPQQRKEQETDQ